MSFAVLSSMVEYGIDNSTVVTLKISLMANNFNHETRFRILRLVWIFVQRVGDVQESGSCIGNENVHDLNYSSIAPINELP